MEDEKNILDATEYILLALNAITNFDEFIEYKEEIEKAIYDIKNSLFYIINSKNKGIAKKYNKLNLSSAMELRYNYDDYLRSVNFNKQNKSITENKEKNGIFYNKSIRNKFKVNNKNTKQALNKKDKLNQITDIIMKLNSKDYFYDILTKLFGNDLKEQLTSNEVSDELITAVQNSIQEIEVLKIKDDLKKIKKDEINNLEEMEEEPRSFPENEIIGPNDNIKNYKKLNKDKYSNMLDIYQEFDFIKNLRQNKSSCNKKEKPFISTTSIYGNYFDPPLQKGGISKLDVYKK